ncbi:hypothetical protein JOM56_005229 [Amanita muscaria]
MWSVLISIELEMSTIEVSEHWQLKGSPAEAALKLEASVYGSVAPYTDEQLKAIRPIPMLPGDGGPSPEAYHIHLPIQLLLLVLANGVAKCLHSLKPHFQISVFQPLSFPLGLMKSPRFVRADLAIKPYDEDEDSCTDIFE